MSCVMNLWDWMVSPSDATKEHNFVVDLAISVVLSSLLVAPIFTSNVEHKEAINICLMNLS